MSSITAPAWFITGCSTGLGRELARQALARGDRVVLTARKTDSLIEIVALDPERAVALPLDVTDGGQIGRAVAAAEKRFGGIDILVSNAGYGYIAAIEEGEKDAVRRQFETNVVGLLAATKHILPLMRARCRGHTINLSSIGGLLAFPAFDEVFGPLSYKAARRPAVTIEMHTSFIRPFQAKHRLLIIRENLVSASRTLLLMEAKATSPDGKLIAVAMVHCAVLTDSQSSRFVEAEN